MLQEVIATRNFTFIGRVLPERAQVTIEPISFEVNALEGQLALKATVSISLSLITVNVTLEDHEQDINHLRNYVEYLVSAHVASLGFANGCGYEVEITAEVSQMPPLIFGVGIPELAASEAEITQQFIAILEARSGDLRTIYLDRALLDYRDEIRRPHDTWYMCYRAIESLLPAFTVDDTNTNQDRKAAWQSFHQRMNTTTAYVDWLRKPAQQRRHGNVPFIDSAQRIAALKTVREVIRRYAVLITQSHPLDPAVFSILSNPELESGQ